MLRAGLIFSVLVLVSACSSTKHFGHETRELDIPEYVEAGLDKEEGFHVNRCIYDAINESLQTRSIAWWDSGSYNCAVSVPYRGRLVVKLAESGIKHFCVQAFEYSQMSLQGSWSPLEAKEFVACRKYKTNGWRISYDLDLLEHLTLMDIMS